MQVLMILVNILNLGIDYDLKRGDKVQASIKAKARDRVLAQMLSKN